jgi:hypothetical protein
MPVTGRGGETLRRNDERSAISDRENGTGGTKLAVPQAMVDTNFGEATQGISTATTTLKTISVCN